MIRVESVSKAYALPAAGGLLGRLSRRHRGGPAAVQAVRDISFSAEDGRITGLLGPNGAGKTTTLRMLAGLVRPDRGRVQVAGLDVSATAEAAQAVRSYLGVLSDGRGLYPRLTARENIVYHGRLHGLTAAQAGERAEALAARLDLGDLLDRRADGFSQGERMKTALARALVHDPSHIVLDEPTNGLDVLATRALRDILRRLRDEEGKCIIFCTHIMQEVERLCDRVVVVAGGCNVADGSVAELLARTGQADFESAFVQLAYARTAHAEVTREYGT